jgi:hypothetical protein
MGASSLAPPRREASLLGAIAADFHFAPPSPIVLAAIIEQPAARVTPAFSDAVKIAFGKQADRRERNRTQRRLDRRSAHTPRPAARQGVGHEFGLGDTSRVKSGETGEGRFGRLGVAPERRADIVDRRAKLGRLRQEICGKISVLDHTLRKPLGLLVWQSLRAPKPFHDVRGLAKMVLV